MERGMVRLSPKDDAQVRGLVCPVPENISLQGAAWFHSSKGFR